MTPTVSAPADWHARAASLTVEVRPFVGGGYVEPHSDTTVDDVGPRDGRVLAQVPNAGSADVDRAVAAARAAFEDGRWRDLAPVERKRRLLAFAEAVERDGDHLALLETVDVGKPIGGTTAVDVPAAVGTLRWYAEAADKAYGEVAPLPDPHLATVRRQPVGVVAAVVPWNYPLIITAWKIGPALAAGNSVVVKPAEQSPLATLRLGALAAEAGIPDGVLNVVPGDGPTAGQPLGRHPDVDALAFTGSTDVGRRFLRYAADSNLKEVQLELGGKSPQIVFADCADLDTAAEAIAWSICYNAGQTCHAGSRLVVEAAVEEELLERIARVMHGIRPGDPLDPATRMGAIASQQQHARITGYLDAGRRAARLVLGGAFPSVVEGGCYVEPTIFTDVTNDMAIGREEVFGPVLTVHRFDGEPEQAVALGDDTPYGLAAAVWTADVARAHRVARRLRVGTVWINTYDVADVTVPTGGWKASGFGGRDRSLHAFDHVTQLKTTVLAL